MRVHLVDGTYELFRHHFALPGHLTADGREVGAVRGVVTSMVSMLEDGATHVGIATDHVIESFRNDLYEGYKDGSDLDPVILGQFGLLEDALEAAGFAVFADGGVRSRRRARRGRPRRRSRRACRPGHDLHRRQGPRPVRHRRRPHRPVRSSQGSGDRPCGRDREVRGTPESIPDYLGLVGDSADGFPGLPGWGAKSAATVLARYGHIEDIPASPGQWDVAVRGAAKLARTLQDHMDEALLFRRIATIDYDAPTIGSVDELQWRGPGGDFAAIAAGIDAPALAARAAKLAAARGG